MREITVDSFGANCPENWEEIADYLNEIIVSDGLNEEEVEDLWERYCSGRLDGAPEAQF